MSERPSMIKRSRLVELLEGETESVTIRRAVDLVRLMESTDLQLGLSTAQAFTALMRRKLKYAADAGLEFDGWPALEVALSAREPSLPIAGVALPDGGSIVLTIECDVVLGCLTRIRPGAERAGEASHVDRLNAEDE